MLRILTATALLLLGLVAVAPPASADGCSTTPYPADFCYGTDDGGCAFHLEGPFYSSCVPDCSAGACATAPCDTPAGPGYWWKGRCEPLLDHGAAPCEENGRIGVDLRLDGGQTGCIGLVPTDHEVDAAECDGADGWTSYRVTVWVSGGGLRGGCQWVVPYVGVEPCGRPGLVNVYVANTGVRCA